MQDSESVSKPRGISDTMNNIGSPALHSISCPVDLPFEDPRFAIVHSLLRSTLLENAKSSLELEKHSRPSKEMVFSNVGASQSTFGCPQTLFEEALRAIVYLEEDRTTCLEEIVCLRAQLESAHDLLTAQRSEIEECHSVERQLFVLQRSLDESERQNQLSQKQLGEVFAISQKHHERFNWMMRKLKELQGELSEANARAERGDETIKLMCAREAERTRNLSILNRKA